MIITGTSRLNYCGYANIYGNMTFVIAFMLPVFVATLACMLFTRHLLLFPNEMTQEKPAYSENNTENALIQNATYGCANPGD